MNNNNKINSLQYSVSLIFCIISGAGLHNTLKISGINSYISIIISFLLGLIILHLTIYIFNYEPTKNIHEKIIYLFGAPLGNIINYLINITISITGIVTLYNFSNFVVSQYLQETPVIIIEILLGIFLIHNISKGIETITRSNLIFITIGIIITIFNFIFLIPEMKIDNLYPVLEYGILPPLKGSISLLLVDIVPIFSILTISKNQIIDNNKTKKYLYITYIISFIIEFILVFSTTSSLGQYLTKIYEYPEYMVLKKINILNFFDKIENLVFITWLLNCFSSLTIIIYYISNSIKKNNKTSYIPLIIIIIFIILSNILFKNNIIFTNFIENIFPLINLFLLIIFIIISINIFIRKRLIS